VRFEMLDRAHGMGVGMCTHQSTQERCPIDWLWHGDSTGDSTATSNTGRRNPASPRCWLKLLETAIEP
jgi:hypothetical protein